MTEPTAAALHRAHLDGVTPADTITVLPDGAAGTVIVSGSHGGRYAAALAAKARPRAVILNDAGVGKDGAGIAGLDLLQALGIPAATVDAHSCRIGDAADMLTRGRISHRNALAAALEVAPGQRCHTAARALAIGPLPPERPVPTVSEGRRVIERAAGRAPLVLVDSAALVRPDDAGAVVVTGSHGGIIGGNPAKALKADALAALFNDAGLGPEACGATRLPVLDDRGIAAVTVAAMSARIGDAASTLVDGVLSRVNRTATGLGAREGMPAQEWVERL